MADDDGFVSRWSRRKALAQRGETLPAEPPPLPPAEAAPPPEGVVAAVVAPDTRPAAEPTPAPAEPLPTLADVEQLTPASDFSRFVARDVNSDVKNAALKKLFADPHYNLMDGLDTYIDDYGKPDPLPSSMLRQLVQSKLLGLFDDEPSPPATAATQRAAEPADEDPDLRLQPDDDTRCASARPGLEPDPGRES